MTRERKLLVLDLDETLVHARDQPLAHYADLRIGEYYVYLRPYLTEFVAFALDTFRVDIWTSSGALYAEPLVGQIFPEGSLEFVWSAARCTRGRDWESMRR